MSSADLQTHLASGLTRLCQCWAITRNDGVTLGFTDHDRPLHFDGITFAADSGMTAKALSATSGMAVNNTQALGMLTADSITENDIAAGRYDNARVIVWQVQWDNVAARQIRFRGTIGEITRTGQAFQADLRGLTDALNQLQGRSYLKTCSAVLGDNACKVALDDPRFAVEVVVDAPTGHGGGDALDGQTFDLPALRRDDGQIVEGQFEEGWFDGGMVQVMSGAASGLRAAIKHDRIVGARRRVQLWQAITIGVATGDTLRLVAGCDKRADTCRVKFDNLINFQGFPHMPGDDWLLVVPRSDQDNAGGSLTP